jgi:hypothetical protein
MWMTIWIILIILIIITIIVVAIRINTSEGPKTYLRVKSTDLQTGDLLFVSYRNSLGYFMKVWSNSKWTHTAMIYKAPDDNIYVMETANYPDKKGVQFLSIDEWYRYNKGCDIGVMRLRKPKNFDSNNILESFEQLSDKKLDTIGVSWLRLLTKKKYTGLPLKENITCYEMTVHLLQSTNIVECNYTPASYFPIDIIEHKLPMKEGFRYDRLSKFIF